MQVFAYREPVFPLSPPPKCRFCGVPGELVAARHTNPNGNAGRAYYTCTDSRHGSNRFIAWDDAIDITPGNPRCRCNHTSRRSRRRDGDGQFYSCPIGKCSYSAPAPDDGGGGGGSAGPGGGGFAVGVGGGSFGGSFGGGSFSSNSSFSGGGAFSNGGSFHGFGSGVGGGGVGFGDTGNAVELDAQQDARWDPMEIDS